MPAIIVPATPVKAVFMNALRERRLSSGSIMGYRLYEVSMCLEWESVPPGNQRVPESRPCKHGAASARRTRSSGTRFLLPIRHLGEIDSDPPHALSETPFAALRPDCATA